jgi:hypothetical protein
MLLRSREEDESLREPDSQIEELSWTYEGSSQHKPAASYLEYHCGQIFK